MEPRFERISANSNTHQTKLNRRIPVMEPRLRCEISKHGIVNMQRIAELFCSGNAAKIQLFSKKLLETMKLENNGNEFQDTESTAIELFSPQEFPIWLNSAWQKCPQKDIKISITYSGGGFKGAAYMGFDKALFDAGIFPDIAIGQSAGALRHLITVDQKIEINYEKFAILSPPNDFHGFNLIQAYRCLPTGLSGKHTKAKIVALAEKLGIRNFYDNPDFFIVCNCIGLEFPVIFGVDSGRMLDLRGDFPVGFATYASCATRPLLKYLPSGDSPLAVYRESASNGGIFAKMHFSGEVQLGDGGEIDFVPFDITHAISEILFRESNKIHIIVNLMLGKSVRNIHPRLRKRDVIGIIGTGLRAINTNNLYKTIAMANYKNVPIILLNLNFDDGLESLELTNKLEDNMKRIPAAVEIGSAFGNVLTRLLVEENFAGELLE